MVLQGVHPHPFWFSKFLDILSEILSMLGVNDLEGMAEANTFEIQAEKMEKY